MGNWASALRTLIQAIRPTFEEHSRRTKTVLDECDLVDKGTFQVALR
ncbi:hypothetical protein J2X36_004251 [Methylobacterium sp. BE186]|nr:hypothetical protein [Methylobacterium sp. BE186]MDR7039475.1 hypothetical protein [Methylobacterium sp. BE186]